MRTTTNAKEDVAMTPISFREHIPLGHRARIFGWIGDSQVWMKTAVKLDQMSGRGQGGEENINAANVAHVCTGFAFELVLKALVVSEGVDIKRTHKTSVVYGMLREGTKSEIAALIQEGGMSEKYLFDYLDERMSHPDRKYWMVNPKQQNASMGFVQNIEGLVIPDLAVLHEAIVGIATHKAFERRWALKVNFTE